MIKFQRDDKLVEKPRGSIEGDGNFASTVGIILTKRECFLKGKLNK